MICRSFWDLFFWAILVSFYSLDTFVWISFRLEIIMTTLSSLLNQFRRGFYFVGCVCVNFFHLLTLFYLYNNLHEWIKCHENIFSYRFEQFILYHSFDRIFLVNRFLLSVGEWMLTTKWRIKRNNFSREWNKSWNKRIPL